MIIGSKKTAYPVPGIHFDGGRDLFVEILTIDKNEDTAREIACWIEKALKTYAETHPGVKFTRKTNMNPLQHVNVEPI